MSALLLGLLMAAAPCPVDPPTRAGLLKAEADWVKALETRDAAALACRLAPEFVDTAWNGKPRDRAAVLTALPRRTGGKLILSDLEARLFGKTAGLVRGLNTQGQGAVRFTDMFVFRESRWQAVSAQETIAAKVH